MTKNGKAWKSPFDRLQGNPFDKPLAPGESEIIRIAKWFGIKDSDLDEDINMRGLFKEFADPNEDAVQLVRRVRGTDW